MIYIKKDPTNVGPYQVLVVPADGEEYRVDITENPQPFEQQIGEAILAGHSKKVVEVAVEDVSNDLRHPDDRDRVACPAEVCDKDYATQANLDKHIKSSHGNIIEQLLTTEPVEA